MKTIENAFLFVVAITPAAGRSCGTLSTSAGMFRHNQETT